MEHIDWTAITNAITAVILVVITWLIYQTNLRLTHFTGALESHSTTMLRIEAARGIDGKPVEVATKCDLCLTRPEGPACVQMCPHGSAVRISFKEMERVGATLK